MEKSNFLILKKILYEIQYMNIALKLKINCFCEHVDKSFQLGHYKCTGDGA